MVFFLTHELLSNEIFASVPSRDATLFQSTKIKSLQNIIFPEQTEWFIESTGSNLPVHLSIPRIRVNAPLEHIGVTLQGAMDVPKGRSNAGWFNLGPRPGEQGSAVIDGHYGVWKNGEIAVFNNLYKLRKGDKLYIRDARGLILTFVVRELRTYRQNEDASRVFISNDGKSHLNLITCKGVWNKYQKNYPDRLIVFTDKE